MRRAARVDANHAEIARTLRRLGWAVHDTSGVGGGFPDLVIGKAGRVVAQSAIHHLRTRLPCQSGPSFTKRHSGFFPMSRSAVQKLSTCSSSHST